MLRQFLLLAALVLSGVSFADNVTFLRIDKAFVQQRVQQAPQRPEQRVEVLRAMFEKAGCAAKNVQIQPVPELSLPNVICTLPGSESGTILIGASLDYDQRGETGAVGWGGVAMLPLLAESLTSSTHRHSLVFVAFAGQAGAGSAWYLKNLTDAQRRDIRGMVDLDHIGRTAAGYATPTNDKVLERLLPAAARALQVKPEPAAVADVPDGDATIFQHAHIPAITIYSPGYLANATDPNAPPAMVTPVLLGQVQNISAIPPRSLVLKTALDPAAYNDTYNLLCVYALFLDRGLGTGRRPSAEVMRAAASASAAPGATEAANRPASSTVADSKPAAEAKSAPVVTASNSVNPGPAAAAPAAAAAPPAASTVAMSGASPDANPGPVFRVNTRLVQVDVVVTDNQGRPIKGLTEADFNVSQDGSAQKVSAFEAHVPASTALVAATATNGTGMSGTIGNQANTFTNAPTKDSQNSWTIVLFDLLNTAVQDQSYARAQLLKLLKSTPSGQPVALFVLTRHLEMLQGFTQDPAQLLKMAELLDPGKSQLLTTMVERERTLTQIAATAAQAAPNSAGPAGAPSFSTDSMAFSQASRIAQGYNDHEAFRTNDRVMFTLESMKGLARAVSGYPGRKNLIWLSGSFPIQIEPDPLSTDEFRNVQGFESEIRSAATLLATSRVAVYPVDVRGLQGRGIDISVSTAESQTMNDVAPATAQGVVATSASNLGTTLCAQSEDRSNDRATMKSIAQQTGGEAFINSNDLKRVMARSLEDGTTYYTLAYTPPKEDANGGYHRVAVNVSVKNAKLAYRRGYYSIPQPSGSGEAGTAALRAALQPGMPPSTSLLFVAQIQLPDAARKDVQIDYVIDGKGVHFADVADNKKRAQVDCIIIAFDREGHEVAHASDTLDASIPLNAYNAVLNYGMPAHQLISLPPGSYNLRIGVMDRTTQEIGTVDAPLVVPGQAVAQR